LNSGESILVTAPQAQVKLVLFFTQAMDFRVVCPHLGHLMSMVLSCSAPIVASLVRACDLISRRRYRITSG
jgi:hypothetical protein